MTSETSEYLSSNIAQRMRWTFWQQHPKSRSLASLSLSSSVVSGHPGRPHFQTHPSNQQGGYFSGILEADFSWTLMILNGLNGPQFESKVSWFKLVYYDSVSNITAVRLRCKAGFLIFLVLKTRLLLVDWWPSDHPNETETCPPSHIIWKSNAFRGRDHWATGLEVSTKNSGCLNRMGM